MLLLQNISHFCCLVQVNSPSHAREHIINSLAERGIILHYDITPKLTALPSNLKLIDLGLGHEVIATYALYLSSNHFIAFVRSTRVIHS
jgi:hypothetical protein